MIKNWERGSKFTKNRCSANAFDPGRFLMEEVVEETSGQPSKSTGLSGSISESRMSSSTYSSTLHKNRSPEGIISSGQQERTSFPSSRYFWYSVAYWARVFYEFLRSALVDCGNDLLEETVKRFNKKFWIFVLFSSQIWCFRNPSILSNSYSWYIQAYDAFVPKLDRSFIYIDPIVGVETYFDEDTAILQVKNFADSSLGATVLPEFTSKSYEISSPKNLSGLDRFNPMRYSKAHHKDRYESSIVLESDLAPGRCWAFQGISGYFGIHLSQEINISHFTIGHTPKSFDTTTAPKTILLWSVIPEDSRYLTVDATPSNQGLPEEFSNRLLDGQSFAHLATAEFNVRLRNNVQSFVVPLDKSYRSQSVIFQILDNWGSVNFTCLYSIRVHGSTIKNN